MHCIMWWVPLWDWLSKFACLLFILDAFAKLREEFISFAMSVCLSAWNKSAPTGRTLMIYHFWVFFEITSKKFKINYNLTRITGTLHEYRCTFMIISRSFLLAMRIFLSRFVEKIKTHILCSICSCFLKSCFSWDNVEKYSRDGQATIDNIALVHFTLGIYGYSHNSE